MRRSGRAWFYRAAALLGCGVLVVALLPAGHNTVAPASGPAGPAKAGAAATIASISPASAATAAAPAQAVASVAGNVPAAAQPAAFTSSSGGATAVPAVADGASPVSSVTSTIAPDWSAYLPHGAGAATPKPVPAGLSDGHVGAIAVNLRAGPDGTADKLDVLQAGEAVKVAETNGNWVHVYRADGSDGWIYGRYLAGAPDAPAANPPATATATASTTPTAQPSAQSLVGRYARMEGEVPLRSAPAGYSQTLFMLQPGERVRITDTRGGWMRVTTEDGYAGWIPG